VAEFHFLPLVRIVLAKHAALFSCKSSSDPCAHNARSQVDHHSVFALKLVRLEDLDYGSDDSLCIRSFSTRRRVRALGGKTLCLRSGSSRNGVKT